LRRSLAVLLVTYEFPPHMNTGGIGSYMFHLARMLSNAGHKVTVFSATHNGHSIHKIVEDSYVNYIFPVSSSIEFREAVRVFFHEFIDNECIDIVESPEVGACALGIKQDFPGIPLLVRLHTPGVLITKVSNSYQPIYTKIRYVAGSLLRGRFDLGYWSRVDKNRKKDPEFQICLFADYLVSPSEALGIYLSTFWQFNKLIQVIPNPFRADDDLLAYPIHGRDKLICFVGKLTILKGMFALTKAVNRILQQNPDYRFVFVGRDEAVSSRIPSMRGWMEKKLKRVMSRVEFTGPLSREGVNELLGKSRICVVPSLWENYPTIVLEAMAAGTVLVASDRGGIPEIIHNGKTGYLINPRKPSKIANAVNKFISKESERQEIAAASREWILNSQTDIEHSILDLYQFAVHK